MATKIGNSSASSIREGRANQGSTNYGGINPHSSTWGGVPSKSPQSPRCRSLTHETSILLLNFLTDSRGSPASQCPAKSCHAPNLGDPAESELASLAHVMNGATPQMMKGFGKRTARQSWRFPGVNRFRKTRSRATWPGGSLENRLMWHNTCMWSAMPVFSLAGDCQCDQLQTRCLQAFSHRIAGLFGCLEHNRELEQETSGAS